MGYETMRDYSVIKTSFLALGAVIAGLVIGFISGVGGSEHGSLRLDVFVRLSCLAIISYLIPTLWFIWRKKSFDPPSLAWLSIPVLGTVILQAAGLIQVGIEQGSEHEPSTYAARLLFSFIFCSMISCIIVGSAQIVGLGVEFLWRRFH